MRLVKKPVKVDFSKHSDHIKIEPIDTPDKCEGKTVQELLMQARQEEAAAAAAGKTTPVVPGDQPFSAFAKTESTKK